MLQKKSGPGGWFGILGKCKVKLAPTSCVAQDHHIATVQVFQPGKESDFPGGLLKVSR